MFGENAWVVTALDVPAAIAIALTVRFDATRNGAKYGCEVAVGVLPLTV
jgi:hypothetical protein